MSGVPIIGGTVADESLETANRAVDEDDEDAQPRILSDRGELEEPVRQFAAADRKVRGFRVTLARQIGRVTLAMAAKIDPAQKERDKLGEEIARVALANRTLVAGEKTTADFDEGRIVFYDGQRGEFRVHNNDELALALIELGHKGLVAIGSKVTYSIDLKALKELIKSDKTLCDAVTAAGLATYAENKTVTVEPRPTPQERKNGVKPDGYVYPYN